MKSSLRTAQLYPFCLQQQVWKQFSKTINQSSPESGLNQGTQEDEIDRKNLADEPYLLEAIHLWQQRKKDWKYTCW